MRNRFVTIVAAALLAAATAGSAFAQGGGGGAGGGAGGGGPTHSNARWSGRIQPTWHAQRNHAAVKWRDPALSLTGLRTV